MTDEDVELLGLNTDLQAAILKHSLEWFFFDKCVLRSASKTVPNPGYAWVYSYVTVLILHGNNSC